MENESGTYRSGIPGNSVSVQHPSLFIKRINSDFQVIKKLVGRQGMGPDSPSLFQVRR